MNWKKTLLYGLIIWAIGFVVASILIAMGLSSTGWFLNILMLVIMAVVVWAMTGKIEPKDAKSAIQIGTVWLVVTAILEYLVTYRTFVAETNPDFYRSWSIWVGYALILLIPWIRLQVKSK